MSVVSPKEMRAALKDWLGDRVKFHQDWPKATTAGGWNANGVLHHWDAIPKRYSLQTHLRVLRHGHAGLPGPLCHFAPARNGDLWVIGWGNCNHAGTGDKDVFAKVLAGKFDGSPKADDDSVDGNARLYGLEYMYHPDDGPMPDVQIETGILCAAAIADAHGWTPEEARGSNLDHFEWASRKWDRNNGQNLANRTRRGVYLALKKAEDDAKQPAPEPTPAPAPTPEPPPTQEPTTEEPIPGTEDIHNVAHIFVRAEGTIFPIYRWNPATGKFRFVPKAEWHAIRHSDSTEIHDIPKARLDHLPKEQ